MISVCYPGTVDQAAGRLAKTIRTKQTVIRFSDSQPWGFFLVAWLTEPLRHYFESTCHSFEGLLPAKRLENKAFLRKVFDALQAEPHITRCDINHLHTLTRLADSIYN